ncbi:alpha-E domain-containing protein [Adhaeribacter arboris]|uniref:Alpha-E domain-containing protein n=1 Tax=Adhaeribacter arboris TaxID=2072846 RepID=A0A2T2YC72_9BACT|nr:alpha-E domain-containing protein [Adhaeribacter arboris]PSR53086.1 alpha-E domain-containing protein [Adhaeribacter arboris]
MLSRIGNSLFWMGRYIERAEHVARYTKVHYVSSLDAPLALNKENTLESILDLMGQQADYYQKYGQLTDDDVLCFITIDDNNPSSIVSTVNLIRENARGTRDSISMEIWEAINRFYHSINKYDATRFQQKGIFSFSREVEENSSVIKGLIANTLIRDEVWMLISLGINLERAVQICKMILTTLYDVEKIDPAKRGGPAENYQWTMLLKSAQAFDMYKRYYKTNTWRRNILDFLLFNATFPKSLAYNLSYIQKNVQSIAFQEAKGKDSITFKVGKSAAQLQFMTIEEVEDDTIGFLNKALDKLYKLGRLLEEKYLVY